MRKLIAIVVTLACVFGQGQAEAEEIESLTVVSRSMIDGQVVDGLFKSVYNTGRKSSVVDIEIICDGNVSVVRVPLVPFTRGFVIISNFSLGDKVVSMQMVSL